MNADEIIKAMKKDREGELRTMHRRYLRIIPLLDGTEWIAKSPESVWQFADRLPDELVYLLKCGEAADMEGGDGGKFWYEHKANHFPKVHVYRQSGTIVGLKMFEQWGMKLVYRARF